MTIHLLTSQPEGYKELTLPGGKSIVKHNCARWTGESKLDSWQEPKLEWVEDEFTHSTDLDADFIKFSGSLVVTDQVKAVLEVELGELVEFLPVAIAAEKRYIINILNVLDLMDKERSKYKIYSDGNIGLCEHAYINEPNVESKIYKVSGFLGCTFVNDAFVMLVKDRQFTGLLIRVVQ